MKKSTISPWSWIKLQAHRALAKGGWYQFAFYAILVVLLLGIISLGFSYAKECTWAIIDYQADGPVSAAFYHLFTNGGENKLGNMPDIGWLITIIGVVLVAVLTSLFTNSFDKLAQRYLAGETHYKIKNHVAVFGYHEMLPGLLKQLYSSGYDCYFIIQTNKVEKARNELARVLTKPQMNKIILQEGDISSILDLPMMRIQKSREVFILGEDMMLGADSSHDTAVLQCLENIVDCIPAPAKDEDKVLCHVMFEHHSTFAVFQHTDLNNKVLNKLAFMPFNYYAMWARKVFVNDSLMPEASPYLPLEGKTGIGPDSEDHVHLVVIGMSRMGVAMGMQAAHLGHYPNYVTNPRRKTRITFIDKKVRDEMYHLQGSMDAMFQTASWRYVNAGENDYGYYTERISDTPWRHPLKDKESKSPYKTKTEHLGKDFIDLEWEFINGDVENPAIQDYIKEAAEDVHTRLTIAVCVPNTSHSIAIGLNLPHVVYKKAVQVLVYQPTGDSIVSTLSNSSISGFAPYARIHSFGMRTDAYDLTLVRKLVYAAGSLSGKGAPTLQEMLVSDARRQLKKASESKSAAANMWSNIYNASHMWTKLRSVGSMDGTIPEEMVDILGKTEHVRWNVEQLLTRYRPLLETEQREVILGGDDVKNRYKREERAHLDITSRERLESVDAGVVEYDPELVKKIPGIYRGLQTLQDKN